MESKSRMSKKVIKADWHKPQLYKLDFNKTGNGAPWFGSRFYNKQYECHKLNSINLKIRNYENKI